MSELHGPYLPQKKRKTRGGPHPKSKPTNHTQPQVMNKVKKKAPTKRGGFSLPRSPSMQMKDAMDQRRAERKERSKKRDDRLGKRARPRMRGRQK